jgi:Short C-terminal domain/Bacterial PH domain
MSEGAKLCTDCGTLVPAKATDRRLPEDKEASGRVKKMLSRAVDGAFPIEQQSQTEGQYREKQDFVLPWMRARDNMEQTQEEAQRIDQQDFVPPETYDDFPGEIVLLRVTQSRIRTLVFPHSIIATERVLILKQPTAVALGTFTEIPYEQIHSIKRIGGVLYSTLKISAGADREIEIHTLSHSDADAVIEVVHKRQEELRMAVTTRSQEKGAFSVADELQKLATLRDDGILSENEFQTAKKRLLNGG